MNEIENVIFEVAEALRVPVLILILVALALSLIELGAFVVELLRRRRRDFGRLETAAVEARGALERGDETAAKAALRPVAWSTAMARALAFMVDQWARGNSGDRLAKGLADFDFRSLRRLERTRLLVRAGPALGLMGTLIPLSPALEGLADGNTSELSDNLRVAFSVTVLGLLVGAVAFGISLVRDRLYGQDLSDLEFVAATLAPDSDLAGAAAAQPRPATGGALPPPPPGAAAAGDKPPPPKEAKPLAADLPPPGGAPAVAASAAPSTPGRAGPEPAPTPAGGPGPAAEPPPASPVPVASPEIPEPPPPPTPDQAGGPAAPPLPPPPIPEAPTEALPSEPAGARPTQAQNRPPGDGRYNGPAGSPEIQ